MSKIKSQILKYQIGKSRDRLYRVALAWSGDEMLADDLVQEAMTAGIANSSQLRDENRLFVWLYSILNNTWCKYLRSAKPQTELDDELPGEESFDPFKSCEERETVSRVRRAVATLPPDQSRVIALVDLDELTYGEVSEVLGIPIGTVMSRLHRARKNLLMRLEKPLPQVDVIHSGEKAKTEIRIVK